MLSKKILAQVTKFHIRTFIRIQWLGITFRSIACRSIARLKIACLLLFASILTSSLIASIPTVEATSFESNVPDIGQGGDWVIDTAQERLLGFAMMQKINEAELVTRDNVVNDYLHNLSIRLQAAAPHTDFKLHYFCIENDVLNAFAFLGGHIAVHSGLIIATERESELAAVLSHETAHITQQHLARIITTNKKMTPLTMVQLAGAIALGALGGNPEAGMHLANAAMGAHVQNMINFTRGHEKEADRIGIQILSKAGFDPHAMESIFKKLSAKMQYHEKPPEYLLTHPMHEDRMADAYNRAIQMPRQNIPDSLFYQLIRARVVVGTQENARRRVKRLTEIFNSDKNAQTDKTALEYALALALSKNRQYNQAEDHINNLIDRYPNEWIFKYTLAEIERDKGNYESAAERFKFLSESDPNNFAANLMYVELLIETKKVEDLRKAKVMLMKLQKVRPFDANLLQSLAKVQSLLKNKVDLHQTQAEWHHIRGEYKEAEKQLDIAIEYAEKKEPYRVTRLNARKKELESELKQIKKLE